MIQLLERLARFGGKTCLISNGQACSYDRLFKMAEAVASHLKAKASQSSGQQIAFLLEPGPEWVAVLLGIWLRGDIAIPLGLKHPWTEVAFLLRDAEAGLLVVDSDRRRECPAGQGISCRLLELDELLGDSPEPARPEAASRRDIALLLYTSGSTGRPKGVPLTHGNVESQISTLVSAWGWSRRDHILHCLPLNHTHGLINALLCSLWSGAVCEFVQPFDPGRVWEGVCSGRATLLMGVPTMYARLLDHFKALEEDDQGQLLSGSTRLRLAVSGSAALPLKIFHEWREVMGQPLLERYGMTEIGMALSNPLVGDRRAGTVGTPLPGVEARLMDENGELLHEEGQGGEIEVRGPSVFQGYWKRPAETENAFRDGWFRTGDIACIEDGYWKILGRKSTDIIKSGGYKVSALEVENVLLEHAAIREAAVIGVADSVWGETVCAFVILHPDRKLSLQSLQSWARTRLSSYKIPRVLIARDSLPRNAIGKVMKPELSKLAIETSGADSGHERSP